jgi:hypothetical protein
MRFVAPVVSALVIGSFQLTSVSIWHILIVVLPSSQNL